jgi:hypothetical protein
MVTMFYNPKEILKTISIYDKERGWKRLNKTDFERMYNYYLKRYESFNFDIEKD